MTSVETCRHYHIEGANASSMLASIASDWGYDCELPRESGHIAEGLVTARRLPCGVNVFATDLLIPEDNVRSGRLRGSTMVLVNLGGSDVIYDIDDGEKAVRIARGGAAVVSSRDDIELTCRSKAGDRSRTVVVQASPDSLGDDELAAHLDRRLGPPVVETISVSGRARGLAHDLFRPKASGIVGRLYAESCALELLARAIGGSSQRVIDDLDTSGPRHTLTPRDVAAILRVRDKLVANLDADHRLSELAREAGMSASTLKSKFVAVVRQPVFQFLRDRRLERACEGLRENGWSVSQASHYVGYRHPTNFATAFRRRFGVSPKEAR